MWWRGRGGRDVGMLALVFFFLARSALSSFDKTTPHKHSMASASAALGRSSLAHPPAPQARWAVARAPCVVVAQVREKAGAA